MARTAPRAVLTPRRGGRRSPQLRVWRVPSPPAAAPAELAPRLARGGRRARAATRCGRPRPTPPQRARRRRVMAAAACGSAVDESSSCGPAAQDPDRRTPSGARARWPRPARAPCSPIPGREGGASGATRPGLVGIRVQIRGIPQATAVAGVCAHGSHTGRRGDRWCALAELMVVCRGSCHLSVSLFSPSGRLAFRRFQQNKRANALSSGLTATLPLMASPDGDC